MNNIQTSLDATLTALADPTRRAILRRVSEGEARVTELAKPFDMSLAAVSKHIKILERANLVSRTKKGREHILTFNPAPLTAAVTWIETQKALWSARLHTLDDLLTAEEALKDEGGRMKDEGWMNT